MTRSGESASRSPREKWQSPPSVSLSESLIIDCDSCCMRDISCGDCVISFLIGQPEERSTVMLGESEAQAMAALADVGLVPPLRLVPPPPHSG